jgi:hypothetical protein
VRQGCPLSPLIFVLAVEILACKVRSELDIKGISVGEEIFKIGQLADDTTLFLSDIPSLQRALSILGKFSKISGLNLNINKTQVLPINLNQLELPDMSFTWVTGSFKTLGIWFSTDMNTMTRKNFSICLEQITCQLNIWRQRAMSRT